VAINPAEGEAFLAGWSIAAIIGFCVCWALLLIWAATIGAVFDALASALTVHKWFVHIDLGGPFRNANHFVENKLEGWANSCQKQFGLSMHYMAVLYFAMSKEISQLSQDTLSAGHWIVHTAIPQVVEWDTGSWKKRTNKAAAAAAGAAAGLALLKKHSAAQQHSQAQTNSQVKTHEQTSDRTQTHTKVQTQAQAHVQAHDHVLIHKVIEVEKLPVPFGQTVKNIRARVGNVEALLGATAMAAAMANVLGVASPRCLRDGPLGRFSRALCGLPTGLFEGFLGLLLDAFVFTEICRIMNLLEPVVSEVAVPIVETLTTTAAVFCDPKYQAPTPMIVRENHLPSKAQIAFAREV
jgi:hypothetical protein